MISWKHTWFIFGIGGNNNINFQSGKTVDLPKMPIKRKHFAVAAYNHFIYAICGSEAGEDDCTYVPSQRVDRLIYIK